MTDPENEEKRKGSAAKAARAAYEDYQFLLGQRCGAAGILKSHCFVGVLCPRFRYFNVCRAETGWNYKKGA
eukprot:11193686-Lingulodinium_polyedra.AAC.1